MSETTLQVPAEAIEAALVALLTVEWYAAIQHEYVGGSPLEELAGGAATSLFSAAFGRGVFLDEHENDDRFDPLYEDLQRRGVEGAPALLWRQMLSRLLDLDAPELRGDDHKRFYDAALGRAADSVRLRDESALLEVGRDAS